MARKPQPTVYTITGTQRSLSEDQNRRFRNYAIAMGIRTACVLGTFLIDHWIRWILLVGAVFLPQVAVVLANGSRVEEDAPPMEVSGFWTPVGPGTPEAGDPWNSVPHAPGSDPNLLPTLRPRGGLSPHSAQGSGMPAIQEQVPIITRSGMVIAADGSVYGPGGVPLGHINPVGRPAP